MYNAWRHVKAHLPRCLCRQLGDQVLSFGTEALQVRFPFIEESLEPDHLWGKVARRVIDGGEGGIVGFVIGSWM